MTQTIFDPLKREAEQNSKLGCVCVYTVNMDIYVVLFLLNAYMQQLGGAGNDTGLHWISGAIAVQVSVLFLFLTTTKTVNRFDKTHVNN